MDLVARGAKNSVRTRPADLYGPALLGCRAAGIHLGVGHGHGS